MSVHNVDPEALGQAIKRSDDITEGPRELESARQVSLGERQAENSFPRHRDVLLVTLVRPVWNSPRATLQAVG